MEKGTNANIFIARGIDQRSGIHNIPIGRSENQVNFDTDSEGFVTKRKGYEVHRNIPIRIVDVTDRGSTWEFVASPEIDLLGVPSGPIVINGQAVDINPMSLTFGNLVDISFYWNTFDNLGAFALSGTLVDSVYNASVSIKHVKGLDTMAGIVRNDLVDSSNNEAVIVDDILNEDLTGGQYQFNLDFQSPVQFDSSSYTLFSPDITVTSGNEAYIDSTDIGVAITNPIDDIKRYSIPQSTHGLIGDNFIVQVWQRDAGNTTRTLKLGERIFVAGNGDIEVDIDNPTNEPFVFYLVGVNDGFQQASFIDGVTQADIDNQTPKTFCLTDVSTVTNFWALYRVDNTGDQELVIPDRVYYNQSTQRLCFDFYPVADAVFKAVYLPGLPVSAGVIVSKTDNSDTPIDTGDYDLENGDLALHGINWDGIVVSSLNPEFAYVREIDEYLSTTFEKLTAVASGDLWIEDTSTLYILTANQEAEQDASVQYLTPYFGATANAITDGRGRGISADEISSNVIKVATITNNGDETVTVLSETLTNLQGDFSGLEVGIDKLTIANSEQSLYIGEWSVLSTTIIDLGGGSYQLSLTVSIDGLPNYTPSTADSGATMGIFTDYIRIGTNFNTIKIGDTINNLGGLLGSTVFALDNDGTYSRMWIDPISAERLLPGSVDITWDRNNATVFVSSVTQVVPQDIVRVSGYNRRFKVVSVDVANSSVTLNESITISNFFGRQSTITLDGRLQLPIKPSNNIAQTFPFAPTGEYSTELAALGDGLYTTTYDRNVVKFDGTHISDAGIEEISVYEHSWLVPKVYGSNDDVFGFITPDSAPVTASAVSEGSMTITADNSSADFSVLFVGQTLDIDNDKVAPNRAIVSTTITDIDTDTNSISVSSSTDLTVAFDNDDTVTMFYPTSFGYYFRIEYIDRNNRIQTGTPSSYQNAIVTITRPTAIQHALRLPTTSSGTAEWTRFKIAMYRTIGANRPSDITPTFYKIDDTPALSLNGAQPADVDVSGLVTMSDTTSDSTLIFTGIPDEISDNQIESVAGREASVQRPIAAARPPKSQHLLSISNKMVYGNIKSKPKLTITWARNLSSVTDLASSDTQVNLKTSIGSSDEIKTQYVNSSTTGLEVIQIDSIEQSDEATLSDFTGLLVEESPDAGFLILNLAGASTAAVGNWIQILSIDEGIVTNDNEHVGALVGWHRIIHTDTNVIGIRISKRLADRIGSTPVPVTGLQTAAFGGSSDLLPLWDVVYVDSKPIYDVTMPNSESDVLGRTSRSWARAINAYMNTSAYYARIKDQYNEDPIGVSPPGINYVLGDWGYVRWGEVISNGSAEIIQQTDASFTFWVETLSKPDGFEIFSNNLLSASPIVGREEIFPSRLVVSYGNYPESVDSPYVRDPSASLSAIDVNDSDGEELTGFASFFGESSTGAAQLASTVIVFKTSSVYAVDINTKQQQKLQSMGQGCTIPDSIARTADAIFFANDNGIYKVTRDLNVVYVGDLLGKFYSKLNKSNLKARGYGIADNLNLQYRFAVPELGNVNDKVIVYNFESMSKQAEGSWFFYDNIPISSAKQTSEKFWFGNYRGRILESRNYGDASDYRDDDAAIEAVFEYAPQSFGDIGKYKNMSHAIVQFEGVGPTEVEAFMATNLSSDYVQLDTARKGEGNWKGRSIAFSPSANQAVFYQLKITHKVKDEGCTLNGIAFMVERTNEAKIEQANGPANGKAK